MYFNPSSISTSIAGVLCLFTTTAYTSNNSSGPDYEALPLDTIFPGPWESNIRAPFNKSYIQPAKIFAVEGPVSGGEAVLVDADTAGGISWIISPGGMITFEFEENISGRVCFEISGLKNNSFLVLSYSESPFFADRNCDATGDRQERDLPVQLPITHEGQNCVAPGYNRGGFKYLTVYIPESDVPNEGQFYRAPGPERLPAVEKQSWYEVFGQRILGWTSDTKYDTSKKGNVTISSVWVNCTAFPSNPNGRAYTGYFDSSSSLINRIWYSGAWTLQLSTVIPNEGGAIIDFNRHLDHNNAPQGAWYSNFTIAKGNVVTTDGAKRDRMVWPGDMTIAVPGIAMTTYDMVAVRNALEVIYDHQYEDGSMPYAGPPMGSYGEFSDTYHLHTLVGTYFYVLYSGDLEWLKSRWPAYKRALDISINKVDQSGLLHVSSTADWNRHGMTGHNVEASAILFGVLSNSIKLANWIEKETETNGEKWSTTKERLQVGIYTLYCPQDGMFGDNIGRRGCHGSEKTLPQDGNSWVLLANVFENSSLTYNVSENLRARWIKIGAPAVEFPNVMSPFSSSFELLGHTAAGNQDAAVELMELMWGYMLDGPGMTNSTLIEGYRTDGYVHYVAYWAASRNSHAHGWSAGPTSVLMQSILGIQLLTPLGKQWKIEPVLTKWLSYARGGFATKLGKFEVSIALMRSPKTGRKVEALNVTVPDGTTGVINWGGKSQTHSQDMVTTYGWYRFLDVKTLAEEEWQSWSVDADCDFVKDETWVKPDIPERPEGVVDWSVMEKGYDLAKGKWMGPQGAKPWLELQEEDEEEEEEHQVNQDLTDYQALLKKMEEKNKERIIKAKELQYTKFEAIVEKPTLGKQEVFGEQFEEQGKNIEEISEVVKGELKKRGGDGLV